jgi:hypothetical protein
MGVPGELGAMPSNGYSNGANRPKRANPPQRQILEALSQVAVTQIREMRDLAQELARRQQEGIKLGLQISAAFEEFALVTGLSPDDLIVGRDGKISILGEDP